MMKSKVVVLLSLLVISLFLVGCSSQPEVVDDTTGNINSSMPAIDSEDVTETVTEDTEFLTEEDEDLGDLI